LFLRVFFMPNKKEINKCNLFCIFRVYNFAEDQGAV
jgi:hypothetical protein